MAAVRLEARDAVGRLNADITQARGAVDPQQVRAAREEGRDVAWAALQRDWLAWVAHLDEADVDHARDQWRHRARRVLRDLGEHLVLDHIDTPRLVRGRVDGGRQVAIHDADLHYRQALGRIFSDSYAVQRRGNAGYAERRRGYSQRTGFRRQPLRVGAMPASWNRAQEVPGPPRTVVARKSDQARHPVGAPNGRSWVGASFSRGDSRQGPAGEPDPVPAT